jgi:hypothetical protein
LEPTGGRSKALDDVPALCLGSDNTFAKTGGEFMHENRAFGSKL